MPTAAKSRRNIKKYGNEIEPALRRIYAKLTELDGQVFFFGKQKPIGTVKQTGKTFINGDYIDIVTYFRNY